MPRPSRCLIAAWLLAFSLTATSCATVIDPGEDSGPGTDAGDGLDGALPGTDATMLCGNGVMDPGEQCDDGNNGNQEDSCLDGCLSAFCGDGYVQAGVEACDDGNILDGDGCDASCVPDCAVFGGDAFGYVACVERPTVLPCDNITTSGIDAMLGDEGWLHVPIGFSFDFYGTPRTMISIGSNGTLQFEDEGVAALNACMPGDASGGPVSLIAAFWDDLRPGPGLGTVLYATVGTAPAQRFVVQWQVPRFPGTPSTILVRAVLYEETGDIEICYPDVVFGEAAYDLGGAATVGIQDSASVGVEYLCDQPLLEDGMLVRFRHP